MTQSLTGPPQSVRANAPIPRLDSVRLLVGMITLFTLALISLLVAAAAGFRPVQLQVFSLALLTAVLGCLPIVVEQAHVERRHTVFLLLSLVLISYYAFPAFVRYAPGAGLTKPGSFPATLLTKRDVVDGQIVALIGLVSLLIAYSAPIGRAISRRLPPPRYEWPTSFTVFVGSGMLVVGWGLTIALILGVVPESFGSGGIGTLASGRLFALVPLTLIWLRHRTPAVTLMILIVVPMSMGFGLMSGKKREILMVPALVALTWAIERRRLPTRWIVTGMVALVLIYPANEFYRQVVLADRTISPVEAMKRPIRTIRRVLEYSASKTPGDYLAEGMDSASQRLDGIGAVSVIVRETPERVPYQRGRTLVNFFYAFVPRIIWPGKPRIAVGQWITVTYGGNPDVTSYTAPTQIGEYYLNFGVVGVIGGMLALGLALRVAQEYLGAHTTIPAFTVLMIVVYYLVTRYESTTASMYANVAFALGPLIAIHIAARTLGLLEWTPTREDRAARAP